ncbi:Multidrug and toxin extrusion protein 1 [Oopsacas minuta]|uniref:Multidrug and toxin extrusion protein n=1 Tax=Oopsacas minuta TaxID=111878 RepID=A0AAV7K411_9METZ|nr:Multidrug and toxin extrusion protein 1 [Oopsacas minuta]
MDIKIFKWIFVEIKFLTLLALPTSIICLTEGFQMKLSNIFIGRKSGEDVSTELSALFLGQMTITVTAYPILEGLSVCVSIICSQAYGANQPKLVALYYYRVLFVAILICFPLFSLLISVCPIVYLYTHNLKLSIGAGSYTTIFCCGFPAYAYYKISVCFLQSHNIVWSSLIYLILGNISNGILQYMFIFHYNQGIAGAAAAYVISLYIIALLIFTHIRLSRQNLPSMEFSIDLISDWSHTAKYAIPASLQTFFGTLVSNIFPVFLLLWVSYDQNQLAIYSIMYSLWFMFSLFTMGFSRALTIRVGQLLGANNTARGKRSAIFGIAFGETVIFFLSIFIIVCNHPFSRLFTTDKSFVEELYFNLLLLPFIILSDIILLGQGVMNACDMQQTQAILKFFFMVLLGFILEFLLINVFAWKALLIFSIQGLFRLLCFVCSMVILFCRDWDTFTLKIKERTQSTDNFLQPQFFEKISVSHLSSQESNVGKFQRFSNSKLIIVSKYVFCLLLGVSIFVAVNLSALLF